jgi:uncharacterized membrane protein/thiol-disulfide isomerase/thioredoxin
LTLFGVRHTQTRVDRLLKDHLDYPSLLSIKDVLSEYGIASVAIQKGKYAYNDFETPFICAIQQEDWPQPGFTVVTDCTSDRISYLDPLSGKVKTSALATFEQMDKEIVLLLDGEHGKDELLYARNRKQEITENIIGRLPLYVFFAILFAALLFMYQTRTSWLGPLLLLSSTAGVLISLLLVWHEVDAHNPFIKEVCGGNNRKKLNCSAVLNSEGSTFLGISWSVWGFAYFATLMVCQVLFTGAIAYLRPWSILSIVALLYVPYSLYYQARIVKQWCPLCLATQALIVINGLASALFLYMEGGGILYMDIVPALHIFTIGLAILTATYYAIPLLKQARDSRSYEKRWKKLRFNPDIFRSLLQKSRPISVSAEGLGILIGNPDAKNEIIKVCNPYCGPCSSAHPELEHIIKNNPDVRLRIIFTANGQDDDLKTNAVKLFLAVEKKYGKIKLKNLLHKWYSAETIQFEDFEEEYQIKASSQNYSKEILDMRKWCNEIKIRATPTIFINGRELPDSYRIAELKNFF